MASYDSYPIFQHNSIVFVCNVHCTVLVMIQCTGNLSTSVVHNVQLSDVTKGTMNLVSTLPADPYIMYVHTGYLSCVTSTTLAHSFHTYN